MYLFNIKICVYSYIVNKYINTYHRKVKMRPADVKDNTHINLGNKVNEKNPKFKTRSCMNLKIYSKLI